MNELRGLFFWRFLLLFGAMMYLISPRRSDAAGFFRGHDAQGRGPSEWALMMSVFISGIFAKSVTTAANRGGAANPWTLERVYAMFPALKERQRNFGNQLSGGEQQMLAIGRALMTNPRLLILDEASEGLAPLVREEIWACLARLRTAGQSLLVVDKYVERLIALADQHTIIERGQVVWRGSSAQLLSLIHI